MKIWVLFCTYNGEGHPSTYMTAWWSSSPTTEQLKKAGAPTDQEAALISGIEVKDEDHTYWQLRLLPEGVVE